MKAPHRPLILIVFAVLIIGLCWISITALTTPLRALTSGIAIAATAGVFIWFASTTRFAIARGVIALGATAIAAPMAAVQAATNDIMFSLLSDEDQVVERFLTLDQVMETGWRNVAIGAALGIVLIIGGGLMHRTPRAAE